MLPTVMYNVLTECSIGYSIIITFNSDSKGEAEVLAKTLKHPPALVMVIEMRYYESSLISLTEIPFSSEVNPEAASTFSRILLSFITLVAQTYPCLGSRE